jgi:CysZ protein
MALAVQSRWLKMFKDIIDGISYNCRGLLLGLKTPKLLLLGLLRFIVLIIITVLCAGMILVYHDQILSLIWTKPESAWVVWVWHIVSWILSLLLAGVSVVLSYLISQILFCVLIMDLMSRITERMVTGNVDDPGQGQSIIKLFGYLLQQEIPRSVVPVLFSLVVMLLGWLTPLGPVLAGFAAMIAVLFLAWDNTDIISARRLISFKKRFRFLRKKSFFHLGFGSLFLIPGFNILFLSFAPVGATLYLLDNPIDNVI